MLTLGSLDRPNDAQDNLAMVQDMATQAFVLKLEGVQDTVLSSYHRIFNDGFLEGWKQANAMSRIYIATDTMGPSVASTPSDVAVHLSVLSPLQPATIIPGMTDTLINATIATLEAETNPVDTTVHIVAIEPQQTPIDTIIPIIEVEQTLIDNVGTPTDSTDALFNNTVTTISANEPERTPIENFDAPIGSTDTLFHNTNTAINTAQPLIDLTTPDTYRPYRCQPPPHPHRPYPFLLPPHTNLNLRRPYIPTTTLYGIPPPCDITTILPPLSPTPTPPYPNLILPASSSATPATSSTDTSPTSTTSCLLTTPTHATPSAPAPLPSLLLGPIPPTALLDWTTNTPSEPHAYFAEKLDDGGRGADTIIHGSEYVDEIDTGAVYMRLTFWEAGAAGRALGMFRGGYACGGGVVWGWVWRG